MKNPSLNKLGKERMQFRVETDTASKSSGVLPICDQDDG